MTAQPVDQYEGRRRAEVGPEAEALSNYVGRRRALTVVPDLPEEAPDEQAEPTPVETVIVEPDPVEEPQPLLPEKTARALEAGVVPLAGPRLVRPVAGPVDADDLEQMVSNILQDKLGHFLDDIERRLAQTREIERAISIGQPRSGIHAEDLDLKKHIIDGYTVTANSPSGGSIAWASVHIMYNGVDYTIADGNTANRYVWFVKPGSYTPGTPVTLNSSNTQPAALATGDTMVFVNNSGTPVSVLEGNGTATVVAAGSVNTAAFIAGAVDSAALGAGAVIDTKIGTGAVTNTKILDGAVGTTKVADDAITNAKVGPLAIGTTEIADDAVTNAKVGPQAVGTTEIANSAVTSTQLANNAVLPTKLNILQHVMF